jgi:hypothetical protein
MKSRLYQWAMRLIQIGLIGLGILAEYNFSQETGEKPRPAIGILFGVILAAAFTGLVLFVQNTSTRLKLWRQRRLHQQQLARDTLDPR